MSNDSAEYDTGDMIESLPGSALPIPTLERINDAADDPIVPVVGWSNLVAGDQIIAFAHFRENAVGLFAYGPDQEAWIKYGTRDPKASVADTTNELYEYCLEVHPDYIHDDIFVVDLNKTLADHGVEAESDCL